MALSAYAVYHVIFQTGVLNPVLAFATPIQDGIEWVIAEPGRAWMALAAIAIPHLGVYFMIFEDR